MLAQAKRSTSLKSTLRSVTITQKGKKCYRHNLPLKGLSERFVADVVFGALPKELRTNLRFLCSFQNHSSMSEVILQSCEPYNCRQEVIFIHML